jgi:uncharacterized DUF497 family protein
MHRPAGFEWDTVKAAANERKHRTTFEFATAVFLDPQVVIEDTTRPSDGEQRSKAIGDIEGKLYAVVFTRRGAIYRLISARRTNPKEDRIYAYR